jgi:hypothetical protein
MSDQPKKPHLVRPFDVYLKTIATLAEQAEKTPNLSGQPRIGAHVEVTERSRIQFGWSGYVIKIEEVAGKLRHLVQFHRGEDRYSTDWFIADELITIL